MTDQELNTRFNYHPPAHPGVARNHERIREGLKSAALLVREYCPGCEERDTAIQKLEEAMMWANAAIARRS